MYSYTPFNEIEYTLWQRKKEEITDSERVIFFFHWMLGVKGKVVRAYMDGHGGGSVTLSNGKYSAIDFNKNDMSQAKINKYFDNYRSFQNTGMLFNVTEKIDSIRLLMTHENYWWFQEIERRIKGQVITQPSIPYAPTPTCQSPLPVQFINSTPNKNEHTSSQNNIGPPFNYFTNADISVSPNTRYSIFQQPIY
jgi:hypothetical protein